MTRQPDLQFQQSVEASFVLALDAISLRASNILDSGYVAGAVSDPLAFVSKFSLLKFGAGEGSGKTTLIKKYAKPNDVVISRTNRKHFAITYGDLVENGVRLLSYSDLLKVIGQQRVYRLTNHDLFDLDFGSDCMASNLLNVIERRFFLGLRELRLATMCGKVAPFTVWIDAESTCDGGIDLKTLQPILMLLISHCRQRIVAMTEL